MITKKQFYDDPDVHEMACWMAKHFDDKSEWAHRYQRNSRNWNCNGLYDAFQKYEWDDTDWKNTKEELDAFRRDLRGACKAGDTGRVVLICKCILRWGGVKRGNIKYLEDHKPRIIQELQHMKGLLSIDKLPSKQDMCAFPNRPKSEYRMNAGFSKIYSLLCDYCVMYDSRVAAALGLLARQFCKVKEYKQVPSKLEFRPPPNQTQQIRNASCGSLKFRPLWRNSQLYTEQVMCASWFLRLALEKEPNVFSSGEEGLHELAAGLFMIGYDLGACSENRVRGHSYA